MIQIIKIWFDGEWLYGESDDGRILRQSLLWYKRLLKASDQQREHYIFSTEGIHWREIDEDVSFESFLYDEAEPTELQRFFLTHPEINIKAFAEKYGLNPTLLHNYIRGWKKPSPEKEQEILHYIHAFGEECQAILLKAI